jgi:ribonuclease P protein component
MQRRYRLVRSEEFQRVRRQGRSWSHPLLVLVALPSSLPCSRFGFIVSKRIGKAVVRNHVKRLLREAARARIGIVSPGWDILLIARTPIVEADFLRIGEALDLLSHRAGLLRAPPVGADAGR